MPNGLIPLPQGLPPEQASGNFPNSGHTNGVQVALGDGSIKFIARGISQATWTAAFTPNARDILGSDW